MSGIALSRNIIKKDRKKNKVVFSLKNGKLLDVIRHPNQTKYKGQRVYVIEMEGYAYMVPYVEDDDVIFLKTIFPSRKYTKMYLRKDEK